MIVLAICAVVLALLIASIVRVNKDDTTFYPSNTEYCARCGAEIPEGRQVCPNCERVQTMAEYIERDEAVRKAIGACIKVIGHGISQCDAVDIADEIDAIPAADVVEVRHGEWKLRGGRFRCSVCDGKALLQDVGGTGGFSHEYEQVKSAYCPHCFAKMDGATDTNVGGKDGKGE